MWLPEQVFKHNGTYSEASRWTRTLVSAGCVGQYIVSEKNKRNCSCKDRTGKATTFNMDVTVGRPFLSILSK